MDELNAHIEAYECAQAKGSAQVMDFLPAPKHPYYGKILRELVRVDLEYSWRRGHPKKLEDYQATFPDLFRDQHAVRELAFEEFRLRHQAGQNPSPKEYRQRFQIDPDSWPRLVSAQEIAKPAAGGTSGSDPRRHKDAWTALECFLKEMQHCDQNDAQIRLALQAVRDSLGADAVFHWYGPVTQPAIEVVGPTKLSPQWCLDFANKTLPAHGVEQGQFLLTAPLSVDGRLVHSAAMIRISKTTPAWIVAMSFNPRHLFDASDAKVLKLARRMLLNQRQYAQTYVELKDALFSTIRCITTMIDARDPYTCGHSERVARVAVRLARQMGLPSRVQSDVYLAGLLHDVGKIGIRDDVLLKAGKLAPDEVAHVQEHVVIGDRIVTTIKQLASLRAGVRSHHERVDGRGYPDGLAGNDIPVLARVLAIADACDAMMSARPYRPAMLPREIDNIMAAGAGSQWDAAMIEHFFACRQELYAICQRGLGQSVLAAVGQVMQGPENGSSLPASLKAVAPVTGDEENID